MRKALFLLGILNDSDLDWMAAAGVRHDAPAGTTLIREGVPAQDVFVVIEGLLGVRTARTGAADLAQLRSGEIVGEMSFVDARPPSASVVALEPSLLLAIPRAALADKLERDVAFAARFYRSLAVFLSDRLRATSGRLGFGGSDQAPAQPSEAESEADEMDPDTLESVTLAGARFDWLARRLKAE